MSCDSCDATYTEEKLYQCGVNGCNVSHKILCESCGEGMHRKKNHKFSENMKLISVDINQNDDNQIDDIKYDNNLSYYWNKCCNTTSKLIKDNPKTTKVVGISTAGAIGISLIGPATVITAASTAIKPVASVATVAMFGSFASGIYSMKNQLQIDPKDKAVKIAYGMLQFHEDDLKNATIFNEKQIQKRYNKLAKYYHPDKPHGNKETFLKLDISKRILFSMVDSEQYEFPKDAHLLFSNKDELIAMNKWDKDHNLKAIEAPIKNDNDDNKDNISMQNDYDEQSQGSSLFCFWSNH